MKILDRYLIRQFLTTTLFCSVVLIFLVLVADVFDNLDDFIKNEVTLRQGLRYYLNLVPYYFVQIIQWASFLGILQTLVTLNTHNELTAMKVAGLSITSIIRPFFFAGFIIGTVTFLVNECVVPETYKNARTIREERIEKRKTKGERKIFSDITHYGNENRIYFARRFDYGKSKIDDFIILWLDENQWVQKKVVAKEAAWNGALWEMKGVNEFEISSSGQFIGQPISYHIKIYPEIKETPEDFYKAAEASIIIPYWELKGYLKKLMSYGLKPTAELVDLHKRLAFPWNSLVVMFTAFPLLAKTATRKSIALSILYCLLLVFLFHVATAISLAMGASGKIFPILSVWINNFFFGFGSLFFLDRANN